MKKLIMLSLISAVIIPASSVFAGKWVYVDDDRYEGSDYRQSRQYSNVYSQRRYSEPVVRFERETFYQTRSFGNDRFRVSVTRPVSRQRTVIEQSYRQRPVIFDRSYRDRGYRWTRGYNDYRSGSYFNRSNDCRSSSNSYRGNYRRPTRIHFNFQR